MVLKREENPVELYKRTVIYCRKPNNVFNQNPIHMPLDNLAELNEAPKALLTVTVIQFYSNSQMILQKAISWE